VPGHQCGKCHFACAIAARDESINKLAVGEPSDRAVVEERRNLSDDRAGCQVRHVRRHSRRNRVASHLLADTALTSNILSQVVTENCECHSRPIAESGRVGFRGRDESSRYSPGHLCKLRRLHSQRACNLRHVRATFEGFGTGVQPSNAVTGWTCERLVSNSGHGSKTAISG
jgi:hypothetical protein